MSRRTCKLRKQTGVCDAASSPDLRDQGRDIAWLGRLHRWEVNVVDGRRPSWEPMSRIVQRGGRDKDALRRPLVQLTRCQKNLLRQVGGARRPPGIGRAYDLLAEACRTLTGSLAVGIDPGARC